MLIIHIRLPQSGMYIPLKIVDKEMLIFSLEDDIVTDLNTDVIGYLGAIQTNITFDTEIDNVEEKVNENMIDNDMNVQKAKAKAKVKTKHSDVDNTCIICMNKVTSRNYVDRGRGSKSPFWDYVISGRSLMRGIIFLDLVVIYIDVKIVLMPLINVQFVGWNAKIQFLGEFKTAKLQTPFLNSIVALLAKKQRIS